jgi:threonine/homoserine/homoserine lactone efflux protein
LPGILLDSAVSFGLSYFVAAASPGPNFVVVSRAGLSASRIAAFKTTAGVVLGASVLTIVAATCAHWLPRDGVVIAVTELIFATLLLRWSFHSLARAVSDAPASADPTDDQRHLRKGFLTAASNPFTAMFLATAVDGNLSTIDAVGIVFAVATLWFGLIGVVCRQPVMHVAYARFRRQIEAMFGVVFLVMAAKTLLRLTGMA